MAPEQTWQIVLADDEWASDVSLDSLKTNADDPLPRRTTRGLWLSVGAGLLLLLFAGFHLWQQAQTGLAQAEAELADALAVEQLARQQGDVGLAQALVDDQTDAGWQSRLHAEMQREMKREMKREMQREEGEGAADPPQAEIVWVDLRAEQALVRLEVRNDPQRPLPYRETRFYRESAAGWLRTPPDVAFWGEQQELESDFFALHFRQRDGQAVAAAAPRLDPLYRQMHQALGLETPGEEADKLAVHIVAQEELDQDWWDGKSPLQVQSPLLRPLPLAISDTDYLVEAVALSLRRRLVTEAVSSFYVAPRQYEPSGTLLTGLRTWLAWQSGGLLSEERAELVAWLYADPTDGPQALPPGQPALCQQMAVWDVWLLDTPVYLACGPGVWLSGFRTPTRLQHLPLALDRNQQIYGNTSDGSGALLHGYRGRSLAMATLLAYATQTYGPEAVPALLQAVPHPAYWSEVAPAVFGVSAEEFEAGWRAYLSQEYGVKWE